MKNPLEQFLPVEERDDGLYVKVTKSDGETLNADVIVKTVNNSTVLNFNEGAFRDVFAAASGEFQRIGPGFEYYDEEFESYTAISVTPQKAIIKVGEGYRLRGKKLTLPLLNFYLKRHGVVHGILMDQLEKIVGTQIFEQYIDVAVASEPTKGANARIDMKIELAPELKPKQREDGSVDYRNIQTFTTVKRGELIAEKIPAQKGTPGMTVNGDPVEAKDGDDIALPNGENTTVSDDGLKIFAAATGILFIENQTLKIVELLQINSDVDFSVGNIDYAGDVMVNGNVQPGFTVAAEGSIHVKGGVEAATVISRNGIITIDKGVVGKGDTLIEGKKGINLGFAQDTKLRTDGALIFDKYLLHCTVQCLSAESRSSPGSVVGGEMRSETTIIVRQTGNESGVATKVMIYDKNKAIVQAKLKVLDDMRKKFTPEFERVERQLKSKAALLKQATDVSARQREEVKKWVDLYNEIKKKLEQVEQGINELLPQLKRPVDMNGYIKVADRSYPGTTIFLYDNILQLTSEYINKRFHLKDMAIVIDG